MIVKGIVSAIYKDTNKVSVILPEYDNMTTQPLSVYGNQNMNDIAVNDFVLVNVFNDDFTDAIVIRCGASELNSLLGLDNKLKIFYIDSEGNLGLLRIGSGLSIRNGVLCLTGATDVETTAVLGEAVLGNMILGG